MKGRQRVNKQNNIEQNQALEETLANDNTLQTEQSADESLQNTHQNTPEPTKQELNFKELREQANQAKRERDELKAYLERLNRENNPGNYNKSQQAPEQEEDYDIREDDFIEGRQFKKFLKKQRDLEQKLKQYESQSQTLSVEMQLKNKFRDFDEIVNESTVQKLKDEYPEVFTTIQTSSDLYNKGAAAYKIIKQLGLSGESKQPYIQEKQVIQSNINKPRNPNAGAAPDSPLNNANLFAAGLTPELKEKLRRANLDAIRRRNS